MKRLLFLLICLCCIGLVSVAYAQDIDDDDDDDLYAPQQYIDNNLYNCHLNITSGRIRQKSIVMTLPVAGAKKLIYYGPFQQNMTFSATIPHVLKIFSGYGVTTSSIQATFGIVNPHGFLMANPSATIIIRHGFEARIRLRYDYFAHDFTYNCWSMINGAYYTSGHGRFFSWSINTHAQLEIRCRRVGSTEAWGVCH